jgi:hypothetical protein
MLVVGLRYASHDKDERDGHRGGSYEQDPDDPHLA